MNDVATVDIAVAGKFHAYHLATALSSLSRLRELYSVHRTFGPPKGVPKKSFHNRFDLAYWGALSRFVSLGYSTERKGELFDDWLVHKLEDKKPGVLHSWNGNSHTTFGKLKGTGWRLCLERSCPHNQFQFDLLVEEGKTLDVPHKQNLRALERAIEELYLADIIVAPSTYSAASYKDPGADPQGPGQPAGREHQVCGTESEDSGRRAQGIARRQQFLAQRHALLDRGIQTHRRPQGRIVGARRCAGSVSLTHHG